MDLPFTFEYLLWAVGLGALSAISLPLGSALGLLWRPRSKVTAALTAFGGGALIAALAVELVAPVAETLIEARHHGGEAATHAEVRQAAANLISLLVCSVIGGLLFVVLDQIVNKHGGFLRKTATTMAFLSKARALREKEILEMLSRVKVFHSLGPEFVRQLVDSVRPVRFADGEILFRQGDAGDRLYFIESGGVALLEDGKRFKDVEAGDIVGEIALLTGAPRTATARARGEVQALVLSKKDFDGLREASPELETETAELVSKRLGELVDFKRARARETAEWAKQASKALVSKTVIPTTQEILIAKEGHSAAPLAIWLGILLDGIPESFVIGASLLGMLSLYAGTESGDLGFLDIVPCTLIAGLFLSNFPEAMSSSVGMRNQGWGRGRIFFLWFSLMVVTALGAGVGYWLGNGAPGWLMVGIQGLAAGAMLTMIASTMVPEAVHLGGPTITGLGTLLGFLGAVAFKLLE